MQGRRCCALAWRAAVVQLNNLVHGTIVVALRRSVLSGTSALALILAVGPARADQTIDNGAAEILDGNGAGTRPNPWDVKGDIYVGRYRTGTLTVQNGGSVDSIWGYVGLDAGSSGGVTVTGTNSTWTNKQILFAGHSGTGILTVAAGGTVNSLGGTVGMLAGSDGTVNVTGTDSSWAASSLFTVGFWGKGALNVSDGGTVRSHLGRIGNDVGSIGVATVTGANSAWINGGDLFVGNKGDGLLTISDGGSVSAAKVTIAAGAASKGALNLNGAEGTRGVLATGYVERGKGTASFTVNGGMLRAAGHQANFLRGFAPGEIAIGAGGAFIDSNGFEIGVAADLRGDGRLVKLGSGTLTFTGNSSYGAGDVDGVGTVVRGGILAVAGGGLDHSNADLLVGQHAGDDATLVIRDGGAVSGRLGIVGDSAGAVGRVVVQDANSTWTNSGEMTVGYQGTGSLIAEAGGTVSSVRGFIGEHIGSRGVVVVSGQGSNWTNQLRLTIGDSGEGELTVEAGGTVTNMAGFLGDASGAIGKATVTGDGSTWTNRDGLVVGNEGRGELTIANGGAVSSTFGNVGDIDGAVGLVTVTGQGSHWRSTGVLIVADDGTGTVTLAEGGAISSLYGDIGGGAGSNGTVSVTGSGSTWTNSRGMFVGNSGRGELVVSDGGSVSNTFGRIGFNAGASGKVKVAGRGADGIASTWTNSSGLDIGFNGGGELMISDGGKVASLYGTIGVFAGSTGRVAVTGTHGEGGASTWRVVDDTAAYGYVAVGSHGAGELVISNGGAVENNRGVLGLYRGSKGSATVAGVGSIWANAKQLSIGVDGAGDLTVDEGGVVQAENVSIAANARATGRLHLAGTSGARGVLETSSVARGTGDATILFDGGVLRATRSEADYLRGFASGEVAIGAGGAFFDSRDFDIGVDSEMIGSGGLTKFGGGRLILSGANGYQGGTNLSGGVLQVSRDSNLGSTSGALTFDGGTLATTASFTSARAVTIVHRGTIDVAGGTTLEFTGAIAGTGDLLKSGGGTLTLSGANAYGDTLIQEGVLVGSASSISGDIGNAGIVVFDQAQDAKFRGAVGGIGGSNGRMIKAGTGVLSLSGASLLDWTINAGGLVAAAESFTGNVTIRPGASFAFDQGEDASYGGMISGAGEFIKNGPGILQLTGDNSGFSGPAMIAGGTLVVGVGGKGALGGTTVVGRGATLGGSGSVGTTTIASGGIISPGNSIGTLTVSGDLSLAPGATYQVEVDGTGNSDRIGVSGRASIAGGAVNVLAENRRDDGAAYDPATIYTILSAAGGITGSFDAVTEDFAFLSAALDSDPYAVRLVLTRDAANAPTFCLAGFSASQCATGLGVESLGTGNSLYDVVLGVSEAEAPGAFDQLSGEIHASVKSALMEDSLLVRDAAAGRIRAATGSVSALSAPVLAYGPGGRELAAASADRLASWARAFGAWGKVDGDGNAAGMERSTGGILMGTDVPIAETWRVGVLAGYSRSSFDIGERASSGSSDNYHLGLYGGGQWGNLGFRSGLAYGFHDIESQRSVEFSGFSDRLTAGYDATSFQAFGEFGYRIQGAAAAFEPFANLAYVNLRTDGFDEAGGAAALSGLGQTSDASFTTFGLRASVDVSFGGLNALVRGAVGWRHAFGDVTPVATQAFVGGQPFSIAGAPITKDAAVIEAGLDLELAPQASLDITYNGQAASSAWEHGFAASLAVRF